PAYATMLLCQPPPSTNHSPYTTLFRAGWAAEVRRMQAMASSRINGREADQIIKFLAYDESHRKPAERDKATVDTNSDPSPWESSYLRNMAVRRTSWLAGQGTRPSARP